MYGTLAAYLICKTGYPQMCINIKYFTMYL